MPVKSLVLLGLLPLLTALAPEPPRTGRPSQDTAVVAARIDQLMAVRDAPDAAQTLDDLISTVVARRDQAPFELLWRAARYKAWMADGAPRGPVKQGLGQEAWDLADRALAHQPTDAHARYYAALGVAFHSQGMGLLKALTRGMEGKFNGYLEPVLKSTPGVDYGGPLVTKGRYFHELPWPVRDHDKALSFFRRAAKEHPENLRNYLYMAETLMQQGKLQEAYDAIVKATEGSEAYDPPEARRVKGWASSLRQTLELKVGNPASR
jgi:tetratricopeptide (TPR) repeat protein